MALTKVNSTRQFPTSTANLVALAGSKVTGAIDTPTTVNLAAASTTSIGPVASNNVVITSGASTITSFGTANNGTFRRLRFSVSVTLTYNATSLILPTSANIVAAIGDIAEFRCEASNNWRCIKYVRADGTALVSSSSIIDAFVVQDLQMLALRLAQLKGTRISMVDGIVDNFTDITDINTGLSTNYWSDGTLISNYGNSNVQSSAFAISNGDAASQGKALAYDGNTATYWQSSTAFGSSSGTAFIGQDFGAGNTKVITQIVYNNRNISTSGVTSVKVQYSADASSWSDFGTYAVSSGTNAVNTIPLVGSTTAHRAWRLLANANPTSVAWSVAEVTMTDDVKLNAMTLYSDAFSSTVSNPTIARLAIQVDSTAGALTINTDIIGYISRDGGTTFTAVTLALIQAFSDGSKMYEGQATISGQPSGSSMVYKIATTATYLIPIKGVILQWRS